MNLQVDSASRLSLGVNLPTVVFVPAIKRKRTTPIAEVTPKRKNPKETTRGNCHGGHREGGISRASQAPCGSIEASIDSIQVPALLRLSVLWLLQACAAGWFLRSLEDSPLVS